MISAKYNTPPPQKKNTNKQTNKQKANKAKQNKQTNKRKQKQKTFGVLFFLNAVVIKVIGELYFGKKT